MKEESAGISRREALLGAAGYAVMAAFAPRASAVAQTSFVPDFADPVEALRAHVKLVGSLARETVISFMRLNLYGDLGEGNFVPMFTMNNLLIDYWEPQGNDEYQMTKYEAGFYTEINSYKPLERFTNPVTGEEVPMVNFRLGPVPRRYTPERYYVMGYNPNPLPIELIGDRVFLATQSIESIPAFGGGGGINYLNSFMTYSAALRDMQDPSMASAPVHAQLANKNAWSPWLKMGDAPGGTVARGFGTKVGSLDKLPPGVLEGFRKYTPEILDTKNWTTFVSESMEAS